MRCTGDGIREGKGWRKAEKRGVVWWRQEDGDEGERHV